ncbi:hypothetical protein [Streptomyces aurantiogriseus]|uniref:Uncharacterized protein n=1 Tax=Streptomyces aurantiogriseus TaxID=66870 RepID=A0A918KXT4_9ACTN|nr:hypothetical protein [Streptomyces aurantiogriseus]GGR41931.1 hypothetical protein GCM10010251_68510 [Streptomyces aurantiogriseus]
MRFEDDLGRALRHTAGAFTTDRRSLAEGSLVRGRRRLARRRASVVAGSALTVALLATAGAQLGGQGGAGKGRDHASKPRLAGDYRHFAVTAEEMENILHNGMNRAGIAVARPKVQGTGSSDQARPATATIDFEDGWGAARVTLSVRRVDPAEQDLKKLITCPPEKGSPYEECTTQPDNRAVKGYTEAGKAGGVKKWAVTMLSPNGYLIEVATHNVPMAKQAESALVSRNPRMNPGKLRSLAMFVDGSFARDGEPNSFGTVVPGAEAESGDILPVLKALLPERLHIHSEGGSGAEGHVVVIDRKTGKRTYVEAMRIAGDKEFWNETLADGTKVGTRRLTGKQPGVVQLRVDALRVNGLWISVSAYNAPSPTSRRSGAQHLITEEELKAVATSRTWLLAR